MSLLTDIIFHTIISLTLLGYAKSDETEPPTSEEEGVDAAERSGASLTGSTFVSSLVGLAGAVWFLVW